MSDEPTQPLGEDFELDYEADEEPLRENADNDPQERGTEPEEGVDKPEVDAVALIENPIISNVPQEEKEEEEEAGGDELLQKEPEELEEGEEGEQDREENNDDDSQVEKPELESGEELEEGEVSDEDQETRKERLKPQPTCRFFSKGQCTWGTSCRFKHPGVLDKGNYSMFSAPKPILPGTENLEEVANATAQDPNQSGDEEPATETLSPLKPPPMPKIETAWERGLRQAKEMRKLSQQRKETDVEYEEKRTTMSLTQAELDKENDFYARQASPIHEDSFSDYDNPYEPEAILSSSAQRRVAPPPPEDFYDFHRNPNRHPPQRYPPSMNDSRRQDRRYSRSPPVSGRFNRRVAPPRSPTDAEADGAERRRGRGGARGDEWADPWMRGGRNNERSRPEGGRRRRSYSSESSRSSSGSSSSRSRSRGRRSKLKRRGRSSSDSSRSSRSSSGSRSRSRSSSPNDIPRRRRSSPKSPPAQSRRPVGHHPGLVSKTNSSAPLQKRLGGLSKSANQVPLRKIKKEPQDRPSGRRRRSSSSSRSSRSRSRSSSPLPKRRESANDKRLASNPNRPVVPPVISMDDVQHKRTDGSEASLPARQTKPAPPPLSQPPPPQKSQIKMTLKQTLSTKPANKSVLEKLGDDDIAGDSSQQHRKRKGSDISSTDQKSKRTEKKKKEKKSAADRREDLLKQLEAVENAIAKKRTKIDN